MKPGIQNEPKKKKPAVLAPEAQEQLPFGWEANIQVKSFKENADGTVTVKADLVLTTTEEKKFSSGAQIVRLAPARDAGPGQ